MMFNLFKYLRYLKHVADKLDEENKLTHDVIKDTRAMLNGEETWFIETTSAADDIKLSCVCNRVDNHDD